ncbi:MAG TPA: nucleotide sugar dehydrogenase [Gammaproteobacteria bacterium]|nr:nucleotide sugar dehydrogenase [Gammaproteobacteria bacterium]
MDLALATRAREAARPARGRAPLPEVRSAAIGVVGLGYVGLPLAVAFGRELRVLGYDIDETRIGDLRAGRDRTRQVQRDDLARARRLRFSSEREKLQACNVYIVTVPTPVDRYKRPDLSMLRAASRAVGETLAPGNVVIYESTVYPGATDEVCIPILEEASGLRCDEDFHVGYSPERINPGDSEHDLARIRKITAGSNPDAARFVDRLYRRIITAGTHPVSDIRTAEAAKVIENTQRDVNIALVNEFAMLFRRLGLNSREVLDAAATKWNFLPFRPGLVGGHCIGVDPYYLTQKAQEIGYFPEMILAGRRINDGMGRYIVESVIRLMARRCIQIVGARVLIMGMTFKENCPDLRNSQVRHLIDGFGHYRARVDVWDPWAGAEEAREEYGVTPIPEPERAAYDVVVLAVAHREFVTMDAEAIRALCRPSGVVFDVKRVLSSNVADDGL